MVIIVGEISPVKTEITVSKTCQKGIFAQYHLTLNQYCAKTDHNRNNHSSGVVSDNKYYVYCTPKKTKNHSCPSEKPTELNEASKNQQNGRD